ncbi:MAG: YgfZ/GcvT domain-containing protein [Alphaproteobacteria bacterium]
MISPESDVALVLPITQVPLEDRAVLRVEGPEGRSFLQGLISNDVEKVTPERAIYAALLTPQGKFLFDFIIAQHGDGLLFDTEAARADQLLKRLTMYKLRAKATVTDVSKDWCVHAVFPAQTDLLPGAARTDGDTLFVADPRHAALGLRIIRPRSAALPDLLAGVSQGTMEDYTRHRIALGVPQGGIDMVPDASFLLESNVEEMHGVDFQKGCYVGQELTARTKHRGSVRKRILPLDLEGGVPETGSAVEAGGRDIGTVTSGVALGPDRARVLALMRIDRLSEAEAAGHGLTIAGREAVLEKPDWVVLPKIEGA